MPSITPPSSSRRVNSGHRARNHAARGIRTLDMLLVEARSRLARVDAAALEAEIKQGALLIDIRPIEQRERDGALPEALVIDRNVVEWRLAPTSAARTITLQDGQRAIIVCNEGYQSSLVAATLVELGVSGATDLVGGYQAYLAHQRRLSEKTCASLS